MKFEMSSPAFSAGALIPAKYTCDGADISPPLRWSNPPKGTKSFAFIMDDPDAPMGVWDHWILFNIPAHVNSLEENLQKLPPGTHAGKNSNRKESYHGPCPPDKIHRYYFKLYALDTVLNLPSGITKQQLEEAIKNHVLASAELMAKYDRPR